MKKALKITLKVLAICLAVVVVVVGSYFAYVFLSYSRIEDNVSLEVFDKKENAKASIGVPYSIMTFNVGFGAYSDDYSFFMDGGKYSRAFSKEAAENNIKGAMQTVLSRNPNFVFLQEVDLNSTRSYHINEYDLAKSMLTGFTSVYAMNYNSPYLFYPIFCPHGKSVSSIVTMSKFTITDSIRRSLPIDEGVGKLVDLDRCYSVTHVPVDNGKEIALVNLHLTAYTSDPTIVDSQLDMLFEQLKEEYAKGNYIICAGDFNKDLWGNSADLFKATAETPSWSHAFPLEKIPEHFELLRADKQDPLVPTCRDANEPYEKGHTFVTVLDGFIISDNVECLKVENVDAGFVNSDHNPVYLNFVLK